MRLLRPLLLAVLWLPAQALAAGPHVPSLAHVLVVILENHTYAQARALPYTAALIRRSCDFTDAHAVMHPSQPNYLALWSGDPQNVGDDACRPPGIPFTSPNLGSECEAAGISWRSYAEDLPFAGSDTCLANGKHYTRKHDPWTLFGNLDAQNERPYTDLATDIADHRLPRLAFVIPNNDHNSHDKPAREADAWLSRELPAMIAAVGDSGVVIVTWDEDDKSGATNQILTIFAGGAVKAGFTHSGHINHYTTLRTICDALGIAPMGNAASESPITDVWQPRFQGSRAASQRSRDTR